MSWLLKIRQAQLTYSKPKLALSNLLIIKTFCCQHLLVLPLKKKNYIHVSCQLSNDISRIQILLPIEMYDGNSSFFFAQENQTRGTRRRQKLALIVLIWEKLFLFYFNMLAGKLLPPAPIRSDQLVISLPHFGTQVSVLDSQLYELNYVGLQ